MKQQHFVPKNTRQARQITADWLRVQINADFYRAGLAALDSDQYRCLTDPERADEALEMIDDFEARLGLEAKLAGQARSFVRDHAPVEMLYNGVTKAVLDELVAQRDALEAALRELADQVADKVPYDKDDTYLWEAVADARKALKLVVRS